MSYALARQGTLDLVGGSHPHGFDLGTHAPSRTLYVARSDGSQVHVGAYGVAADGSFGAPGVQDVVGNGSKTRIAVFDNQRLVVFWLNPQSTLRARGYGPGIGERGKAVTVATGISDFDLVPAGVTTGVERGGPGIQVHYAYRNFAFTMLSAQGSWKFGFGSVGDTPGIDIQWLSNGGTGDHLALSCATLNEDVNGTHPRKALVLWRDGANVRTQSWRGGITGVTPLAAAAEAHAMGSSAVHGMSIAPGQDAFAAFVAPGASSNFGSRLQLVSVAAGGALTPYASAEIEESPQNVARLHRNGNDAAVAYSTPLGRLGVAAWRFAAPGSGDAARTVLASATGGEQPLEVRTASFVHDDGDDSPFTLLTLNLSASNGLRLASWRLTKTLP